MSFHRAIFDSMQAGCHRSLAIEDCPRRGPTVNAWNITSHLIHP